MPNKFSRQPPAKGKQTFPKLVQTAEFKRNPKVCCPDWVFAGSESATPVSSFLHEMISTVNERKRHPYFLMTIFCTIDGFSSRCVGCWLSPDNVIFWPPPLFAKSSTLQLLHLLYINLHELIPSRNRLVYFWKKTALCSRLVQMPFVWSC